MALTLLQSAAVAADQNKNVQAVVMEIYAKSSELLEQMQWKTIQGNALSFTREGALPGWAFRGVNEAYTESTGKTDKVTESLAIAGGDLDVDRFIVKTMGEDERSSQEAMKAKSIALGITKNIIKGSVLTDRKAFDGLQVRITGDQLLAAGATDGGDALSLKKLDQLIDMVDTPTHLITSKAMKRKFAAAARSTAVGGYITWDVENLGQRVLRYNGLPIIGVDKDETKADIMPFTEVSNHVGVAATATSMYCVSIGEEGLIGLQNAPMEVDDLGHQDSKPVFRTRIEWYITIAIKKIESAARLWSIKDADIVA